MVYEGTQDYIFVSYCRQDSATVLPVVKGMQDRGFRIWYDPGIEEGVDWSECIAQQLDGCRVFISFMSEGAASSTYCRETIHRAINEEKDILVVYLEDTKLSPGLEMSLAPIQSISRQGFGSDWELFESLCNVRTLQACKEKLDIEGLGFAYRYYDGVNCSYVIVPSSAEARGGNCRRIWAVYKKGVIDHVASIDEVVDEFETRTGERIAFGLPESKLEEFDRIVDPDETAAWLAANVPHYRRTVSAVMDELNEAYIFFDGKLLFLRDVLQAS